MESSRQLATNAVLPSGVTTIPRGLCSVAMCLMMNSVGLPKWLGKILDAFVFGRLLEHRSQFGEVDDGHAVGAGTGH